MVNRNRLPIAIPIPTLLLVLAALGLAWALASPGAASGATLTVTTTTDGGAGSLRQAIADAAPGDTIDFPAGTYTLTTGAELVIDKNLTLNGAGAGSTIIEAATSSAAATSRIFNITGGAVAIADVTVRNGRITAGLGGGINNLGTLTVTNSIVSGNTAGGGGGIINLGTLTLTNSRVSGNTASDGDGGGIYNFSNMNVTNSTISGNTTSGTFASGGGIHNFGDMNVTNSTISGNAASGTTGRGGGIRNFGTLTLTNSTVSDNSAPDGGGIGHLDSPVTAINSIIANNAGGNCGEFFGSAIVSQGHNLSSDGTCGLGSTGDLPGTNPLLGPLQDNGGPTQTHALLAGSPAIDAGDDSVLGPPQNLVTDQRGAAYPRKQRLHVDIGAFEVELTVNKLEDTDDGVCSTTDCSLREAIGDAGPDDTINFDIGSTIILILGQLVIDKDLTIIGTGSGDLTISGNNANRIFDITAGNVGISGMTI